MMQTFHKHDLDFLAEKEARKKGASVVSWKIIVHERHDMIFVTLAISLRMFSTGAYVAAEVSLA